MKKMQRVVLLWCACAGLASAADLASVRTVYIMTMPHGLDQYLANRLTNQHVFHVVTDPSKADAIFTDHVGPSLDSTLEKASPTPKPPPEPVPAPAPESEHPASGHASPPPPSAGDSMAAAFSGATANQLDDPRSNSTFAHAKGTVFLVDAKSRMVVWSVYQPSKSSAGPDLDRTASAIVSDLKRDLNPNPKKK